MIAPRHSLTPFRAKTDSPPKPKKIKFPLRKWGLPRPAYFSYQRSVPLGSTPDGHFPRFLLQTLLAVFQGFPACLTVQLSPPT